MFAANGGTVEIKETTAGELTLLDKERIDTALDLRDGLRGGETDGTADLYLTDRRLVHLAADGQRRRASFVSIQDITAIDINSERGYGLAAFLWGALALYYLPDRRWPCTICLTDAGPVLSASQRLALY